MESHGLQLPIRIIKAIAGRLKGTVRIVVAVIWQFEVLRSN